MALVCDIKSSPSTESSLEKPPVDPDLEDGEIEDDDEEPILPDLTPTEPIPAVTTPANAGAEPTIPIIKKTPSECSLEMAPIKDRSPDRERFSDERERFPKDGAADREGRRGKDRPRGEEKGRKHMTEAERSILHLRKREKMMRNRELWEKKHRKKVDIHTDDDFAKNIEKTLATILNKKEKEAAALSAGEEEKEEKRGKKRKKHDKERQKSKRNRTNESPRSEIDENEILNIRSGSPGAELRLPPLGAPPLEHQKKSRSPSKSEESFETEPSEDERERTDERSKKRSNRNRRKRENRERNRRERDARRQQEQAKMPLQDSQGVCVFYMQGKCQKNDCPYSHEVSPPMKLELCKFYLMDCCAKGENCSYMHSEFPCKFYHTGLQCTQGDDCKFAHGAALSDGLKQILFKHIETAPRDILGGFPRLTREEALNLINATQKKLQDQYGESSGVGGAMGGAALTGEEDKDGAKGGIIPSLFDISVPVPPELAQGIEFDVKISPKSDKNRNRPSRWQQDQDSMAPSGFPIKGFSYGTDQDMRINSNGDVDMRTLPTMPVAAQSQSNQSKSMKTENLDSLDLDMYQREANVTNLYSSDIGIRGSDVMPYSKDIDIRQPPLSRYQHQTMDVDIRQVPKHYIEKSMSRDDTEDELHIDTGEDKKDGIHGVLEFELPQTTKDLLARITANQKDNIPEALSQSESRSSVISQEQFEVDANINWYSDEDDEDENRLTIKVEDDETRREKDEHTQEDGDRQGQGEIRPNLMSPPQFNKTADIVGKLGDLSKIDISAEVTKLLTSMSQNKNQPLAQESVTVVKPDLSYGQSSPSTSTSASVVMQDPRLSRPDPRASASNSQSSQELTSRPDPRLASLDPRHRSRQGSTDSQDKDRKSEKLSIYEQGGLDMKKAALEIDSDDFKVGLRPDIDLRNMSLPFKGMQNYTPATEVDASINSHLPMPWKVVEVAIPRPDYTGLKLSINDAEKTGDPRLRKIFRLSVDEKDSPMSPKASPKAGSGTRVDPRIRKMEEKAESQQLSYSQQLNMLQSSQFYQSLTSNQKLMLNQELSSRYDQSGGSGVHDPVLNSLLSNLNLLPQPATAAAPLSSNPNLGAALSILASASKLNPILPNQTLLGQQGILGAAPGIPNLPPNIPPDYPINFDPRNGGLLGNAPPPYPPFGPMDSGPYGYNDDYYGGNDGGMQVQGGGNFRGHNRGYNNNNRDGRRRGRNFNNRNNRNNFKRGRDRDRGEGRQNRHHSPS